ncbi:MAG: hypothetical protein J6P72_04815 [Firmicutes bacterium]|nr:hypothetical protein [Bacillota bacterium]
MFYEKNREPYLDPELFRNPTCEYRGTPFWAWNGALEKEELARQMDIFKEMGYGGFHMHVRTGLSTPYLSDEYMDMIRFCIDEARKRNMMAYLYDEDRWPSGTCGGEVTRLHPEYARQSLLFTPEPYQMDRPHQALRPEAGRGQEVMRQDNGFLLAVYDLYLNEAGFLVKSICHTGSHADSEASGQIGSDVSGHADNLVNCQGGYVRWYAYIESASDDPWFNNHPYVDTLRPAAVQAFIDMTHERYLEAVGDEFGTGTKTIFTDEPQFTPKEPLAFSSQQKDVFFPWTEGLDDLYRKAYQEELVPLIPYLFFEPAPENGVPTYAPVRLKLMNLLTDRFVDSYCRQIGDWCMAHGLLLTGHVMGEPTLESQTQAVGDAMRTYEAFGIPGIDMLCNFHEYTTAKQTASRVRQLGKEGMLSELYGVTGWDSDFRLYKLQGDWQAALGVTLRVPHLAWMSMKGEAKRDYPASISFQSPWYKKYHLVEDHFARLAAVMTRGNAVVRLGVIHPIESFWLLWGPTDKTGAARAQMEKQFEDLCQTLLFGTIDFDYINEASLEEEFLEEASLGEESLKEKSREDKFGKVSGSGQETGEGEALNACGPEGQPDGFRVGRMKYDVVLVPPVLTLRSSTVEKLATFRQAGGRILWQGECPKLVDGEPFVAAADGSAADGAAADLQALYADSEKIGTDPESVLNALESIRFLEIRKADGQKEDQLIYQLRKDGGCFWLFVCQGKDPVSPDVDQARDLHFSLNGSFKAKLWNTENGQVEDFSVSIQDGKTVFSQEWHMHDSLLLQLIPMDMSRKQESACENAKQNARSEYGAEKNSHGQSVGEARKPERYFAPVSVKLEEPNMLLLDMAEYAMEESEHRGRFSVFDTEEAHIEPSSVRHSEEEHTEPSPVFYSEEEVLRIDNIVRSRLGIPLRRKEVVQPYKLAAEKRVSGETIKDGRMISCSGDRYENNPMKEAVLHLRFRIESEVTGAFHLALEDAAHTKITLNGKRVESAPDGWFVDPCIETVPLPRFIAGENILELLVKVSERTNLEACYLLGDFGVQISGTKKRLIRPVQEIGFGDMSPQGLPFYTGNLIYEMLIETEDDFTIRVPAYRGALVEVLLDDIPAGEIIYAPYQLKVCAKPGKHKLGLRLYGTRQNGFGQVHHTQGIYFYQSPNSWRSDGDLWTYEYQLKKAGILRSPELMGARFIYPDHSIRLIPDPRKDTIRIREHS